VLLTLAAGCSSPPPDYATGIATERARKDEFLRGRDDIILPPDRETFLPLSYFSIDESYAVPAQLQPAPERTRLQMPTSTGTLRDMERIGHLQFTLKGKPLKLSAFVPAGTTRISSLFVPFSNLTSGTETYQAGRYMDLEPTATGIYIVDFNVAYHPYCYYNPSYECPYPPSENRLAMPIRAGERLRKADTTVAR
jgi:uncharacterized protein